MRWFKHLTDAADDEKLADILTEFGPEGFGVWWLLCEVVGKQMDNTERCEASYSLEHWARKLYISKRKASSFLKVFSEKNLIFLSYDESNCIGKIIVKVPNMLKFRDEYSKKSGQTPDKHPDKLHTKIQIQTQKQKDKKPDPKIISFFDDLWDLYPRKIGRPDALRHYLKTVKTEQDMRRIDLALGYYLDETKNAEMKFIKHGSAWFNSWQNWEVTDAD